MNAKKEVKNKSKNAGNLKLPGGRLCLDFVNTVEWWGKERAGENLKSCLSNLRNLWIKKNKESPSPDALF